MSTPFPLEEQAQTDSVQPSWDPWKGPTEPSWHAGMGFNDETAYLGPMYRVLEAAGSGAAKGEAMLGGAIHQTPGLDPMSKVQTPEAQARAQEQDSWINTVSDAITADAKARVQAMTPNPQTTGTAVNLLHGLVSGGTEMAIGGLAGGPLGAAAVVGGSEGHERYQELKDQGVDEGTAKASGLLAGVTAGAGALVPAGIGESLLSKVVTGAIGNTAFGAANRYADHQILEASGYPEMAAQQKALDGTQVLTDLILGGGFGALAHLHGSAEEKALKDAPGATDAALTANLALRDRQTAPGIPVDPEAANAHSQALEKAITDMLSDKPVDVSDSDITEAHFLEREEMLDPESVKALKDSITENDLYSGRDVQAGLESRQPTEPKTVAPEKTPEVPEDQTENKPPSFQTDEDPADRAQKNATNQILEAKPDLQITDEDGNKVSASDAMQAANDELATTRKESQVAVQAAIKCYLSRGG
jgi:hypothetical protein